jgi:hypothetical protein
MSALAPTDLIDATPGQVELVAGEVAPLRSTGENRLRFGTRMANVDARTKRSSD